MINIAYTEVSVYGYITGDELQAFHICTYASVDARYTEAAVMAQVSQAERWVNEFCGQSFSGTIPDGVVSATLEMARYYMNLQMLSDGWIEDEKSIIPLKIIEQLCSTYLYLHKVTIGYSASASDFNLPNLEG